jgi:hypothetical protein
MEMHRLRGQPETQVNFTNRNQRMSFARHPGFLE